MCVTCLTSVPSSWIFFAKAKREEVIQAYDTSTTSDEEATNELLTLPILENIPLWLHFEQNRIDYDRDQSRGCWAQVAWIVSIWIGYVVKSKAAHYLWKGCCWGPTLLKVLKTPALRHNQTCFRYIMGAGRSWPSPEATYKESSPVRASSEGASRSR